MNRIEPAFIFSLPRAGSTLLQRILVSNENISSSSEPWILLPFVFSLRKNGVVAEYKHQFMAMAIQEFCKELPDGLETFYSEIKRTVETLYKCAADQNSTYFLDKTPRYSLIVEEIIKIFPDAKFIFLWRNPLAIYSSMIETWGHRRWCLHRYKYDLYDGLSNLVRVYSKYRSKSISIQYESFLKSPDSELARIMNYLDLPYDDKMLENFSKINLKGEFGDPTGTKKYSSISSEPLEKWKETMCNPIRKAWCLRYLRWLGEQRLRIMGYDFRLLSDEVKSIKINKDFIISDFIKITYGVAYSWLTQINIAANTGISGLKGYKKERKERLEAPQN